MKIPSFLRAFAATITFAALSGSATTLQLKVVPPGATNEFSPQAELEWVGAPGVTYVVQSSTNLADLDGWRSLDLAARTDTGPLKWMAPESISGHRYYRVFTQPLISDVQPAFIDSDDTSAVLYILGQLLPTNATVVINGQNFTPTVINSNGVWATVSLNGLPPGTPLTGTIIVVDNATGATSSQYKLKAGFLYAAEPTTPMIQPPPTMPPASPEGLLIAFLTKKGYDYYQAQSALARYGSKKGYDYWQAASESAAYASKKGYDYWQTQSALHGAGAQNNPAFAQNDGQGSMPDYGAHNFKRGNPVGLNNDFDPDADTGLAMLQNNPAFQENKAQGSMPEDKSHGHFRTIPPTGEVQHEVTDLAIPGAMLDFAWTRTYRSRTGPTTAQGAGWDFSFNVSLTQNDDGTITLRPGNGHEDIFYPDGTNWVRDEYFCEIHDLNSDGMPDVLFADTGKWLFNPSGPAAGKLWQIIDRNGNTMSLNYDTSGRLGSIVDDLGRTNSVGYDTSGRIASLTDFTGRMVRYEYNTDGDLAAVISPPVVGTPTGNDFPGGITNRYTYTSGHTDNRLNHNLVSFIDGKGQTQFEITYSPTNDPASSDFDTVISTQRGIEKKDIKRGMVLARSDNGFATTKVIVRDALGNVTESFYDSRQRCVRLLEYTGRAPDLFSPTTETLNRPVNKLRAEDPEYFETKWTWNRDSLCTLETLPDGGSTRFVYESDFSPTASGRKKGDCRVVRLLAPPGGGADLDGDGSLDISELAWSFEYDPRFGSPMLSGREKVADYVRGKTVDLLTFSHKGWDGTVKGRPPEAGARLRGRKGWDGLIYGNHRSAGGDNTPIIKGSALGGMALRHKHKGWDGTVRVNEDDGATALRHKYKGWNGTVKVSDDTFMTRVTDPRGNVTTAEFDVNGNARRYIRTFDRAVSVNDHADLELTYNPRGQLTAITNAPDANGFSRVDTLSYYTNGPQAGQLQSVVIDDRDLLGLKEYHAFEYDAVGNLTRYVDPRTNDWMFTYNALGQCIRVQSPVNLTARSQTDFIYDANGSQRQVNDDYKDVADTFIRTVSSFAEFDALNRCTAVIQQVASGEFITNRFEYDANDNLVTALSPLAESGADPHALMAFEYDERGLLFRETGAPGSGNSPTNEYGYDANGAAKSISLGIGATSVKATFTVPSRCFGQPNSIIDPMGNETRFNYDRNGNCTLVRFYGETNDVPGSAGNILLAQSNYKYDGRDHVIQCTTTHFRTSGAPVGDGVAVTTYAYAPNGACTNITDDNGITTTYDYDAAGRVYLVKTPRTVVQATRDAGGNVTSIIQTDTPDGGGPTQQFSVGYSYDSLGRCIANWDNVGNTNSYAYDSFGRLVRETDPRGVATVVEYDDLGRHLKMWVDKNGDGTIHPGELDGLHVYDANSRVVAVTDANTNTTRYAYDPLGNCTTITNADTTVMKLIWSPRSNLVGTEDPNGTIVTNLYDLNNRLVHRDIAPGSGVALTTTFEHFVYDGAGRCVLAENNACTNTFAYDSLGNCVLETQAGWQIGHLHDNTSRRIAITYPSGLSVNYAYNAANDVANISATVGSTTTPLASFAYDGPGRLRQVQRANGTITTITSSGLTGVPNAPGDSGWMQVRSVVHGGALGSFWTGTNKWDAAQNSAARHNFQLGSLAVEDTIDFAFDGDNRLIQSLRTTNGISARFINYILDNNGNRQLVQDNGVPQFYVMSNSIPPGDFQVDRYSETPFGSQTYDLNGNLIAHISSTAQTYYEYDYANRLVSVAAFDAGNGTVVPVADYAYDALGRRIRKTVPSSSAMLPPVVTEYLHLQPFGGKILVHGDSDIAETYVDGALLDSYIHKVDDGLTIYRSRVGGPSVFYHSDDFGNTVALTDGTGAVIERYVYDDFGLPYFLDGNGEFFATNSSPAGNLILFGGAEWDAETGLYYHQNPLYDGGGIGSNNPLYEDPKTGRATRGKVKNVKDMGGSAWSEGGSFLLKKEEGGRHTPFHNKYRPQYQGAKMPRNVLKDYFQTGDKPTQAQFSSMIDSLYSANIGKHGSQRDYIPQSNFQIEIN